MDYKGIWAIKGIGTQSQEVCYANEHYLGENQTSHTGVLILAVYIKNEIIIHLSQGFQLHLNLLPKSKIIININNPNIWT